MDNTHLDASSEYQVRLEKVKKLRAAGYEPWSAAHKITATCAQVISNFVEGQEHEYVIAGRVTIVRDHGKSFFAKIQDRTGALQVYVKQDVVGADLFTFWQQFIDLGDIVWFQGTSFRTKTGEITLKVTACGLLSKCLHPLPEKFHGIADQEIKYRQRYLDLISSAETRNRFITRSRMVAHLRRYLDEHDYIEVETPMLQPIPGGASARPFVTHHNALDADFYLRIAPELYLKRLVVGGFERVYEINRNFRNEGISTRHNPEFTMLEYYTAHEDYHFAMDFLEAMLREVIHKACGALQVSFGDHILDFGKPFARLSVYESVKRAGNFSDGELSPEVIDALIKKLQVPLANAQASYGEKLYAFFEHMVEKTLIQPTFITDYPIEISPLAKRDARDSSIAARFELFVAGMELANGYSELNDPIDQAQRFKDQGVARERGDVEAQHYDADYVLALEHALPPTAGVGLGIDRLTMLLTNTTSIKEVILFPTLKKKELE